MRITTKREVRIPDPYKLELYRRAPDLGPRILFFSGGSALRDTSHVLSQYTFNSIHLITPFDSGGSSAIIRDAFRMPAVGDIRHRLMAMADQSVRGNPAIFDLFAYRLPKDREQKDLLDELMAMAEGKHPLVSRIPDPMRKIIRNSFHQFIELMPDDFDLRGASIGNLVLTAGYLTNRRQLDPVIYIFSKLVQVRGVVRPTIDKDLHMAVRLEDDTVIIGQHNITGKETDKLTSPVRDIWLTANLDDPEPVHPYLPGKVRERILEADLICYPIGSIYSSVMVNLMPLGVGQAVATNNCPKVFVPNTGKEDPEALGMTVDDQIDRIIEALRGSGAPEDASLLEFLVVDTKRGKYPGGIHRDKLKAKGVTVIDCTLITEQSKPLIDENKLSEVLLSLA